MKDEDVRFSATNRSDVKHVLERIAEKLVIKCMDEKAEALRESIEKIYEMADRGLESRAKQKRRVLLFDMLRLLLCMSRQPAIWKNRRQGLKTQHQEIRLNEENKQMRVKDRDYETWRMEFKNDNEGINIDDFVYDDDDDEDDDKDDQDKEKKDDHIHVDSIEQNNNNDIFKDLPLLARLPLEHNNILFDDTKDVHFVQQQHQSQQQSNHNEFRAIELQNRLRVSLQKRAAENCGFAQDTSLVKQWAHQYFNHHLQCSESQVVWQTLQALQGVPGVIFKRINTDVEFDLCDLCEMPALKHTSVTALRSTLQHILNHVNLIAKMRHRIHVVISSAVQSVEKMGEEETNVKKVTKTTKYSAITHALCSELLRILQNFETWLRPWIVTTSCMIHKNSIYRTSSTEKEKVITLISLETQLEKRLSSMYVLNRMLQSILKSQRSSTPPCVIASRLLDELVTCLQRETMLRGVYDEDENNTPYHTLLRLFEQTARHYLETIDTWMLQGKLFDPQNESFVAQGETTYSIRSDGVPRFMQSVAHMVLETGVDMKVLQQLAVSRDREDYGEEDESARVESSRAVSRLSKVPRLVETLSRSVKLLSQRNDNVYSAVKILIERGLLEPIRDRHARAQINLANILKLRMGLTRHLYALRSVYFMGREGDLLQRFLNSIFELGHFGVDVEQRRIEVELTNVLCSCLESDEEYYLYDEMSRSEQDLTRHANRFSVKIVENNEEKGDEVEEREEDDEYAVAASSNKKETNKSNKCLSLQYETGWLVQRVITRDCMKEYNTIFRLLLEVKHAKHEVVRAHIYYMKNGRGSSSKLYERASRRNRTTFQSNVKHSLHIDVAEILHVVGLLELYFMSRVHACWDRLREAIASSESIDEMKSHHEVYLAKIRDICLLRPDTVVVLDAVRNVLRTALKFAALTQNNDDDDDKSSMKSVRNTFRGNVKFLLLLLRRQRVESENEMTVHLRGVLTQLDFNGYFGGLS